VAGVSDGRVAMDAFYGNRIIQMGEPLTECRIGAKPPQDHPLMYLNMSEASEIVCRIALRYFGSTRAWAAHEADPADCAYDDMAS
jgi:uncharacterized Zn-finger protein